MRAAATVALCTLFTLACGGLAIAAPGPEETVENWLRLGSEAKLDEAREHLQSDCTRPYFLNVAPTHILGVRIAIETLETELVQESADEARVRFALSGAATGDGKVETKIGETEISFDVQGVNVDQTTMSGEVDLARTDAGWRIVCTP